MKLYFVILGKHIFKSISASFICRVLILLSKRDLFRRPKTFYASSDVFCSVPHYYTVICSLKYTLPQNAKREFFTSFLFNVTVTRNPRSL